MRMTASCTLVWKLLDCRTKNRDSLNVRHVSINSLFQSLPEQICTAITQKLLVSIQLELRVQSSSAYIYRNRFQCVNHITQIWSFYSLIRRGIDAHLTHLMLLLLVSVPLLHANAYTYASQQAQLEKFILSRKARTSGSSKASVHKSGVARVKSNLHLQAGYFGLWPERSEGGRQDHGAAGAATSRLRPVQRLRDRRREERPHALLLLRGSAARCIVEATPPVA